MKQEYPVSLTVPGGNKAGTGTYACNPSSSERTGALQVQGQTELVTKIETKKPAKVTHVCNPTNWRG